MRLFGEVKDLTFGEVIEQYRAELNRLEQGLPSEFCGVESSIGFSFDDGIDVRITVGRDILEDE